LANPDADGSMKTLKHWEILRKTQNNNNLLKNKRLLKRNYKLSGEPSASGFI